MFFFLVPSRSLTLDLSGLGCLSCRLGHSLRFTYYILLFLLVFPFVVCSLPRSIWANYSVSLSASCRYSPLGIAQLGSGWLWAWRAATWRCCTTPSPTSTSCTCTRAACYPSSSPTAVSLGEWEPGQPSVQGCSSELREEPEPP